jgi:hypothetical protein
MDIRIGILCLFLFGIHNNAISQEAFQQETPSRGSFSGAFETNANIFLRDSAIGASGTPQYDRQFFGGEAWLNLNYQTKDLQISTRFDMYNNSNLLNPFGSYTGIGIGRWFVQKKISNLTLSGGYIYDQIGSGIIFRAFENRPLFIDNALYGASLKYDFGKGWSAMAFAGRQKNAFETFGGNLKGVRVEGFLSFGSEEKPLSLAPGIGFVNRTISDESMELLRNKVRTYLDADRFKPLHNTYAATIYNTLSYGSFTLYTEAALKTKDIFDNPFAIRTQIVGTSIGKLEQKSGSILYGSLGFVKGKLGLTAEVKRTENFNFRIDPNAILLRGLVNFLQPLNRQNTFRLTARYSPAAQDLSEMAYTLDAKYKFNKSLSIGANFSDVAMLDGTPLFRELFTEVLYKFKRKWQLTSGLQLVNYNQKVYEGKADAPTVRTIVPYADFLYRFSNKKSLRTEFQYMHTKQDFGSWIFGLLEYTMAPRWSFETSAMYNNDPKAKPNGEKGKKILYPTLGLVFYNDAQRYSVRYVKQVEGIVCSGGICRLEPAFSGIRMQMNTTF